jgi:hypothetical protein
MLGASLRRLTLKCYGPVEGHAATIHHLLDHLVERRQRHGIGIAQAEPKQVQQPRPQEMPLRVLLTSAARIAKSIASVKSKPFGWRCVKAFRLLTSAPLCVRPCGGCNCCL